MQQTGDQFYIGRVTTDKSTHSVKNDFNGRHAVEQQ